VFLTVQGTEFESAFRVCAPDFVDRVLLISHELTHAHNMCTVPFMTVKVKVTLEGDPEEVERLLRGGDPLRVLCRNECDRFDKYLREAVGGTYASGLANWERFAVEGFLYQKLRGHVDAYIEEGRVPAGGDDGPQASP